MRKILGVLFIIFGIGLALYVSGWVLFIGGIVQVIEAAKANPVDVAGLVWGLIRALVLPETVAGIIFWVFMITGAIVFGWERRSFGRSRTVA